MTVKVPQSQIPCWKVLALSTAILSACTNTEVSEHQFAIQTVNGVLRAENRGSGRYSQDLFEYSEVLKLGINESEPEALLVSVGEFLADDDGGYYVSDPRDARIAVYAEDGKYSHSIGSRGSGPGEFLWPRLLSVRSDTVEVYDPKLLRTSVFRKDGTFLRLEKAEFELAKYIPRIPPSGHPYYVGHLARPSSQSVFEQLHVLRMSSAGDTIFEVRTDTVQIAFSTWVGEKGAIRSNTPLYLAPSPTVRFTKNWHMLISTGRTPMIREYGPNGRLLKEIFLHGIKAQIEDEEVQRLEEVYRERKSRSQGFMREIWEARIKGLRFPDKPAVWEDVFVDQWRFIWLRHPRRITDTTIGQKFFILSPDGEFLGTTTAPVAGGQPSGGRYIGIVQNDTTGQQIPTVFSLVSKVQLPGERPLRDLIPEN